MMPRLLRFKAEDTVADQDDEQGDTPVEQSRPAIHLFVPHVHFGLAIPLLLGLVTPAGKFGPPSWRDICIVLFY